MSTNRTLLLLAALLLGGCKEKASGPTGAASSTATTTATLKAPPTPIKAGQPFSLAWSGPNGPNDYIDLVAGGHLQVGDEMAAAKTSTGNPVKLTAPGTPGTYEVRYVQDTGNRAIIAHVPITVVP